jgi:sugar phosphate isomerase/epimerase
MNRRMFLAGSVGAAAALGNTAFAQAPAPATAVQMDRFGQPLRGRGPGTPALVPAAKLARVNIMTYDFDRQLKFPWTQNPNENQTINFLDLPQMYQDVYGLNHIEFQHSHLVDTSDHQQQRPPDPDFFHQVRAKLDAAKVTATQINLEIGQIPNLSGEARDKWMVCGKQWVDAAPILGVKRLMLNQEGLTQENQANCISVWKEIQDYARPKGIKISCETRPSRRGPGGVPIPPTDPKANYIQLAEIVKAAGGYSNIDIGNLGIQDQQTLNDAIRVLYPSSSGNMHIKSSPYWDIGAAVRYSESLGYRGHYSIEVDGHPAIRQVYDLILANVTNPLTE